MVPALPARALTRTSSCRLASDERIMRPDRGLELGPEPRAQSRWAPASAPLLSAPSSTTDVIPIELRARPERPTERGARCAPAPRLDKGYLAGASELPAIERRRSRQPKEPGPGQPRGAPERGASRCAEGVVEEPTTTSCPQEYAAKEHASPPVTRAEADARSARERKVASTTPGHSAVAGIPARGSSPER